MMRCRAKNRKRFTNPIRDLSLRMSTPKLVSIGLLVRCRAEVGRRLSEESMYI
jgi:hypothetical protein